MHRGVVPLEQGEGPVDELIDRTTEGTVGVGGIGVEATPHQLTVEPIDPATVGEDEVVDGPTIDECRRIGKACRGRFGAHSRRG